MPRRAPPGPRIDPPFKRPTRHASMLDTQVIHCGDNLDRLSDMPDGFVDLIYVDPPFNSNRVYETFWGEAKEKRTFEDRSESTRAYIDYMRPRCIELARVLSKTGSLYWHCDSHASHYVKLMLDQTFGENNFQSEIIWKRTTSHGNVGRNYGSITDSIFFYTSSQQYTWSQQYRPFTPDYIAEKFRGKDSGSRLWRKRSRVEGDKRIAGPR